MGPSPGNKSSVKSLSLEANTTKKQSILSCQSLKCQYVHLSFISTEHLQEVPPATLQQREEVAGTYAQLAHHQAGQVQVHVHSQCCVFTFDSVCNATYTDTKSAIF